VYSEYKLKTLFGEQNMTRERKLKLSPTTPTIEKDGETVKLSAETRQENREKNVSHYACARLNKAVKSMQVFGNCFGSKYEWTPEQIEKAETVLYEAAEAAVNNIRVGKEIVAAGITL